MIGRWKKTREWFEAHKHELVVGLIGAAISIGLAIAAGGDPAEAGRGRH